MRIPGQVPHPELLDTESLRVGADGGVEAYLAAPRDPGARPGIVVIHDASGLSDHNRDVTRRLAAQGYLVIAANLFDRVGGSPPPGDMKEVMARLQRVDDRVAIADLRAAVERLRGDERCDGRIGAVGFCMGGRLTLLLATEGGVLDAAVDCWGGRITRRSAPLDRSHPEVPVERVDRLDCPLLAIFGESDGDPSAADRAELQHALEARGAEHRIVVLPGVGHAPFADHRPSYNETAAFAVWDETLRWFAAHLGGVPASR